METSISSLVKQLIEGSVSNDNLLLLHALGVYSLGANVEVQVLKVPVSITEFYRWDQWARRFSFEVRLIASMAILDRLLDFREFIFVLRGELPNWTKESFCSLVQGIAGTDATDQIKKFGSCENAKAQPLTVLDQKLHLVCTRFLYNVQLQSKLLAQTGFECCTLYMLCLELINNTLPYSRQLPSSTLSAVRHLLVDDQWDVGPDGCELKFKETCEAMIRAIQFGVVQWLLQKRAQA